MTFLRIFAVSIILVLLASICFCIYFLFVSLHKVKAEVPEKAKIYLPVMVEVIFDCWSEAENWDVFAAQIEQETCYSLTHSKCWNPNVELKTSREYGFGLAQTTIAYDAAGKERFNNFKAATKLDKVMKDWRWEDRFNPYYQIRFLVLQDKQYFNLIKWSNDELTKFAFTLAMYNGGQQGILNDRQLCKSQSGDYNNWFGEKGVSNYSWKSKIKITGYGQSFFQINRNYVSKILNERRFKYITYWSSRCVD